MKPCELMRWTQAAFLVSFLMGVVVVFALPWIMQTPSGTWSVLVGLLGLVMIIAVPVLLVINLSFQHLPGLKHRFETCFKA